MKPMVRLVVRVRETEGADADFVDEYDMTYWVREVPPDLMAKARELVAAEHADFLRSARAKNPDYSTTATVLAAAIL